MNTNILVPKKKNLFSREDPNLICLNLTFKKDLSYQGSIYSIFYVLQNWSDKFFKCQNWRKCKKNHFLSTILIFSRSKRQWERSDLIYLKKPSFFFNICWYLKIKCRLRVKNVIQIHLEPINFLEKKKIFIQIKKNFFVKK